MATDTPIVRIVNAATLVCLRRPRGSPTSSASTGGAIWEVLLGQSEVKNWLRSTPTRARIMRYPGEWKFPGGVVDDGDSTLAATALRELMEEFPGILDGATTPPCVHFFSERLTRPIQHRRHRMFNFIALEEDNDGGEGGWMGEGAVRRVNEALAMKREEFRGLVDSGRYWAMCETDKMLVSPEIHRIRWFPIDKAIAMLAASITDPETPVDAYQRAEFAAHGVRRRDPMEITMRILRDIAAFNSHDALRAHCRRQDASSGAMMVFRPFGHL